MADIGAEVSVSLDALTREFETIAHNMANVSTAGFKRRCNSFTRALDAQSSTLEDHIEENAEAVLDFSQGHLVQTDRTLDFALYGKGFFVLETPEGPLYTRHGIFQTNQNGQIVDTAGRLVAGAAGPLIVPSSVDVSQIQVGDDGQVTAAGAAIGRFRIVDFPDNEDQLLPVGLNCFLAPEGVEPVEALDVIVNQGYKEASNVKLVDELVNMIMVSRLYEANMKLVSAVRETTSSMISVAMG